MPVKERLAEILKYQHTVRNSYPSLIVLFVVNLATDSFRNGIQLLPTNADSWMTSAMVIISFLLLINQALNVWYYRQQRLAAEREMAV
jgi:hypothetical protein